MYSVSLYICMASGLKLISTASSLKGANVRLDISTENAGLLVNRLVIKRVSQPVFRIMSESDAPSPSIRVPRLRLVSWGETSGNPIRFKLYGRGRLELVGSL